MEKIDNVGSYLLKADIETIKETMDLINELNDNLKRAKTLIDELAQKKIKFRIKFYFLFTGGLARRYSLRILSIKKLK